MCVGVCACFVFSFFIITKKKRQNTTLHYTTLHYTTLHYGGVGGSNFFLDFFLKAFAPKCCISVEELHPAVQRFLERESSINPIAPTVPSGGTRTNSIICTVHQERVWAMQG